MVLIEDITEQEREREAAEAAAAAAAAAAAQAAAKAAAEAAEQEARARAAAEAAAAQSVAQQSDVQPGGSGQQAGACEGAGGEEGEGGAAQPPPADQQAPRPLTEAEQEQVQAAEEAKAEGNKLYQREQWEEALERYAAALERAPEAAAQQRSVYHCNRAACHLKLEQWTEAIQECSAALELQPAYSKALLRRGQAYEKLDDLEHALADAQKVLELEPGHSVAQATVQRLTPIVTERREKLKEEMMGKLKELGNMVLGKFGLSVDNFKAEKDPTTGSYSIKFSQ